MLSNQAALALSGLVISALALLLSRQDGDPDPRDGIVWQVIALFVLVYYVGYAFIHEWWPAAIVLFLALGGEGWLVKAWWSKKKP